MKIVPRYFLASLCWDPAEGGWTYYTCAADKESAMEILGHKTAFGSDIWNSGSVTWEEHPATSEVTVDRDDGGYEQLVIGSLQVSEVRCLSW